MTTIRHIIAATVLSTALFGQQAGAKAEEATPSLTMKPLHGVAFDVGTRRAAGYFLKSTSTCKLVLTIADAPNWDETLSFTSTRFEVAIPAGKTTYFRSSEGTTLEFACAGDAGSVSVRDLRQVAGRATW